MYLVKYQQLLTSRNSFHLIQLPEQTFCYLFQFATEAAITILRIDDMIRLVKEESQNED